MCTSCCLTDALIVLGRRVAFPGTHRRRAPSPSAQHSLPHPPGGEVGAVACTVAVGDAVFCASGRCFRVWHWLWSPQSRKISMWRPNGGRAPGWGAVGWMGGGRLDGGRSAGWGAIVWMGGGQRGGSEGSVRGGIEMHTVRLAVGSSDAGLQACMAGM